MKAARSRPRLTLEEYFAVELSSEHKFEYVDGEVLAMGGGSLRHGRLVLRAGAALLARFAPPCEAYGSEQRIATGDGVYTYPDASVACGELVVTRVQGTETIHNPVLLLEVLSPSTRDYDLGEKLEHYQATPSVREVLLVEAETVEVRHVRRTEQGWETRRFTSLDDVIDLATHAVRLPVRALYPPDPGPAAE